MVYLDNNDEKQNVFIPRMTVNIQNYTPSTGGGEGYATEEWVESQGYITPSSLKTINGESLVGSGNIVIEGGVPSESDGVFILENVNDLQFRKWSWDSNTGTEIVEYDYAETYVGSAREEHNMKVVEAINNGTCKSVFYKRVQSINTVEVSRDETGMITTYVYEYNYEYVPVAYNRIPFSNNYDFRGVFAQSSNTKVDATIRIRLTPDSDTVKGNEYTYPIVEPQTKVYAGIRSNINYRINKNTLSSYYNYLSDYNVVFSIEDRTTSPYTYKRLKINGKSAQDMQIITLWGIDETGILWVWETPTDGNYSYPTQINLAQADVDLSNYFTKEETEQLISSIDLSNYYTKTETDELINNINIGDGDTIASLVEQEVTEQLTDNFKTINGESIIGEGNIEIEGGGSSDVVFDGTVVEGYTYLTTSVVEDCYDNRKILLTRIGSVNAVVNIGAEYDNDGNLTAYNCTAYVDESTIAKWLILPDSSTTVNEFVSIEDEGCIVLKPLDDYSITVYDLGTNEQLSKESYTYKSDAEAKAFNGDAMKKIKAGLVKSLVVPILSKSNADEFDYVNNKRTTRPQFIYVPLAFGWEYTGNYGYATGVCKYWHEDVLEYNYVSIDMDADGNTIKYEISSMDENKTIALNLNNPNKNVAYDAWNLGNPLYGSYQFDDENSTIAKFPISVSAGKGDGLSLWGKIDRTRSIEVVWSNIYDGSAPTITVYED